MYCKDDEDETEVNKEHLVKAYRYGKSYVPFISDDELKIVAAKRLALISFARNKDVCDLMFLIFFKKNNDTNGIRRFPATISSARAAQSLCRLLTTHTPPSPSMVFPVF
jgi:hypothetical protein